MVMSTKETKDGEYIKLEVTLYFEPELEGSIDQLKERIKRQISRWIENLEDVEIETIKSGRY